MKIKSNFVMVWLAWCVVGALQGRIIDGSVVDQLCCRHAKDLLEQKKVLEKQYQDQVEKLINERSALTEQLLGERQARHEIEGHRQCFEQRIATLEHELAQFKRQIDQMGKKAEQERKDLQTVFALERADLCTECETLMGELKMAQHSIISLKGDVQKYRVQEKELIAQRQKLQGQQEYCQQLLERMALKDCDLANKDNQVAELTSKLYAQNERMALLECNIKELSVTVDCERAGRQQASAYISELEAKQTDALKIKAVLSQEVAQLKQELGRTGTKQVDECKASDPIIAGVQVAQSHS